MYSQRIYNVTINQCYCILKLELSYFSDAFLVDSRGHGGGSNTTVCPARSTSDTLLTTGTDDRPIIELNGSGTESVARGGLSTFSVHAFG